MSEPVLHIDSLSAPQPLAGGATVALPISVDADRLERREGVCGGVWCVRGTRVPVWGLERCRQIGMSCGEVLEDYPFLQLADVLAAWNYASAHPEEISRQIQENEAD